MTSIYMPHEDSYLIMSFIRKFSGDRRVLDMGCGGGILTYEASKNAEFVYGCDINPEAINYCIENKIPICENIEFFISDMFSEVSGKFDLIICNPPYLPYDSREDGEARLWNSGGSEGWEFVGRFLGEAKKYLNPEGKILLLFSSLTGKDKVDKLISENGFNFECLKEKRFFYESLYVYLIEQ